MRCLLSSIVLAAVVSACGASGAQPADDGITLSGNETLHFSASGQAVQSCPGPDALLSDDVTVDLSSAAFSRTSVFLVCNADPKTVTVSRTLTDDRKRELMNEVANLHPKVADHCGACDCTLRLTITSGTHSAVYGPDASNPDCENKKAVIPFEELSNVITIADDLVR